MPTSTTRIRSVSSIKSFGLNPTFKPFAHQTEGVLFAEKHKYSLNCDEPGVGKTLQAVALANKTRSTTLIICPAYLKLNWVSEIEQLCSDQKNITTFSGSSDIYDFKGAEDLEDFIIINYEQIKHAEFLFKWADLIVCDECHTLKSQTSIRSVLFDEFLFNNEVSRLLLMTGTPLPNRVEELYALLSFIAYDPSNTGPTILDRFPTSECFCEYFAIPRRVKVKTRRGPRINIVYEDVKNVEELRAYLKPKMIRRLQEDVLDMPSITHKDVLVSYKPNSELMREFEEHNEVTKKDRGVKAKTKSALVKASYTAKYATDLLDADEQVVIYSAHRDSAKLVATKLTSYFSEDGESKVAYIDGQTPISRRNQITKDFQAGKIRVISATIKAASTGITLTAARHLIFNDLDWSPGNNEQALRRIYRIGQKRKCVIHYIYGSPQDRHIGKKLADKLRVIKAVLK